MKKFLTIGFLLGTSLQTLGSAVEAGSIVGPTLRTLGARSTLLNAPVVHPVITSNSSLAKTLPVTQGYFIGQNKPLNPTTQPRVFPKRVNTLTSAVANLPLAKDSAIPTQVNKSLPEKSRMKAAVSNPFARKSFAPKLEGVHATSSNSVITLPAAIRATGSHPMSDAIHASSPGSAMTLPAAQKAKGFNNPEPVHPGAGGTRVVDKIELISTAQTSPLACEMIHAPAIGSAPVEPMTRLTSKAIPSMPEVFPVPAATSPAVEAMEPIARESDAAMSEPLMVSEPSIAPEDSFSDDSNEDALIHRTTNGGFQAARQLPQADQRSNFVPSLGHATTGRAQKASSSPDQPSYAHQKAPYTLETRAPQFSNEPVGTGRSAPKSFADIFDDIKDAIVPFVKSSRNTVGSGESRRSSGQAFSIPEDTKPYSLGLVFSTLFFCGIRTPSTFISRYLRKALFSVQF